MRCARQESVPQELRLLIEGGHATFTAWFQGWSGLKNGPLLEAAEESGFDLFITADQELSYQQNLRDRKIAIVVLSTNNWDFIKAGNLLDLAARGSRASYRRMSFSM
jgi:hypothetical protein